MRIAMDLDDVLFPWTDHAHEACVAAGITNNKLITQWGFHKDYGIPPEELWAVLHKAYRSGMLLEEPYPGVAEQLARLRDADHTVHLITARGFERGSNQGIAQLVRADTVAWLDHYGVPHDSLTFSQDKGVLSADVGIDDSMRNCIAMTKSGIVTWLMDRPHNQDADPGDHMIPRVHSLERFVELIVEVEAMNAFDVLWSDAEHTLGVN